MSVKFGATRRAALAGMSVLPWLGSASARAATATGRWKSAETNHVVVHGDQDDAKLQAYATRLEDFDMVLRHMHGLPIDAPPPRKLDLYLVDSWTALRRTWPGVSPDVQGYYTATPVDIVCIALLGRSDQADLRARRTDSDERDDVMLHEYVHHFMKQYFNYAYAPWLIEGYAEYFMTTTFDGDQIVIGKLNSNRASWLMNGTWLPLERLIADNPTDDDRSEPNFYPQAWLLTHYMLSDAGRRAQLQAYMRAVGEGKPSVASMEAATGKSAAALQADLKTYSRSNLPVQILTRKRKRMVEATITPMPASADDLLLDSIRLVMGDDAKANRAFAQDVERRAARYPGDSLAERTRARAWMLAGDMSAAQGVIDRYLAASPDDGLAWELKGKILLAAGDADPTRRADFYRDAQGAFGKAFKLAPNRYQTLAAYARSRSLTPGYPSDNVLEALLMANELAPQVDQVTLDTVQALAIKGQYRRAVALLKPVANDPHGGRERASARTLLAKLEDQAAKEPPPAAAR